MPRSRYKNKQQQIKRDHEKLHQKNCDFIFQMVSVARIRRHISQPPDISNINKFHLSFGDFVRILFDPFKKLHFRFFKRGRNEKINGERGAPRRLLHVVGPNRPRSFLQFHPTQFFYEKYFSFN